MSVEKKNIPIFARPRRGYAMSVLDAVVWSLWKSADEEKWPSKSLPELYSNVGKKLGRNVNPAVIRGVIYVRSDLFERAAESATWRLTRKARGG